MHTTSGEDVVEKRITAPGRWLPLWGHKWLIVGLAVVSLAAAWAITRNLPKAYESTTTVLAPKEGGGGGGLAALAVSNLMQNVPGVPLPSVPSFISLSPNRDMISCNFRWSICGKEYIKTKVVKNGVNVCSSFFTEAEASLPKDQYCCDCYPKCTAQRKPGK